NLAHRGMVRRVPDPVTDGTAAVSGAPVRLAGGGAGSWAIPARDADREALLHEAAESCAERDMVTGALVWPGRPLEGGRVVENGRNTVAPLACRQLGALGADVIKIEPPTGDTNRWNAPLHPEGDSYVFAMSNTDKRGLVLNLREEADRA